MLKQNMFTCYLYQLYIDDGILAHYKHTIGLYYK